MTLELESYRSSNSPVLMHAPLDIPEICARLKQPHEAQRRRADDRRNGGISTVARKRQRQGAVRMLLRFLGNFAFPQHITCQADIFGI